MKMVHEEFIRGFIEECVNEGVFNEDDIHEQATEAFDEDSTAPSQVSSMLDDHAIEYFIDDEVVFNEFVNKWRREQYTMSEIRSDVGANRREIERLGSENVVGQLESYAFQMEECFSCGQDLFFDEEFNENYCPVCDSQ